MKNISIMCSIFFVIAASGCSAKEEKAEASSVKEAAEQKEKAEHYIAKLTNTHKYSHPIITQVSPFTKFYKAEDYHIRYFRNHPSGQPYIDHVTKPEVEKFRRDFPELVQK